VTTDSGIQPWRHAAWALLVVFVLAALVLYFAVAWQAHQHPLESSPWNDRRAIVTVVACVALCVLLLARQARLVAWRAFGSVLALLIAVGLFGGVMLVLLGFAWVALVALAAGDAILALVARDVSWDALERVLYGWIVGFAAIGFVVFALALGGMALPGCRAGVSHRRQHGGARLVAQTHNRGVWLARDLATDYRRLFAAQPVLSAFVLAAVCLSLLGAIVWSVAPEIRTDSLIYQLAVPQAYVDHHGLVNLPGNVLSLGMPHGLYYDGTLTDMLDFSRRFRYLLEIDDPEMLLGELRSGRRVRAYRLVQRVAVLDQALRPRPRRRYRPPRLLRRAAPAQPLAIPDFAPGRSLYGQWVLGLRHSREWRRPRR
jgi:hypothetical protein